MLFYIPVYKYVYPPRPPNRESHKCRFDILMTFLDTTDQLLGAFGDLCLHGLRVRLCALHERVSFLLLCR
jgi:hypothetical protein